MAGIWRGMHFLSSDEVGDDTSKLVDEFVFKSHARRR